jgi:hypothetical protein
MKKFLSPLLLALALVGGFTACRSPEALAAGLKIELTNIERSGDGSVRVAWRVQNPNVSSYLLSNTTHKLTLNGTLVGTITETTPLGVPPQSHADSTGVLTPVKPPAGAVLDQAVVAGTAAYRLNSVLTVLLLDEQIEKIPLISSGTVPVTAK